MLGGAGALPVRPGARLLRRKTCSLALLRSSVVHLDGARLLCSETRWQRTDVEGIRIVLPDFHVIEARSNFSKLEVVHGTLV